MKATIAVYVHERHQSFLIRRGASTALQPRRQEIAHPITGAPIFVEVVEVPIVA